MKNRGFVVNCEKVRKSNGLQGYFSADSDKMRYLREETLL